MKMAIDAKVKAREAGTYSDKYLTEVNILAVNIEPKVGSIP